MTDTAVAYDFDRSKLAFEFDVERLQQETLNIISQFPPYIYYNVVPLTVPQGHNKESKDYADPNWTNWLETSHLKNSPYFQEVLNSLECQVTNVRLMRLEPGAEVREHTDPQLDLGLRNQVRLHVPIFISDEVEFWLNNKVVPLKAGEMWYMRLSDPHRVLNQWSFERIQLSIDVVFNDWIEQRILEGAKE
ncbi:MAG: aspartyl/asparaginyl beta-hydroxylase domain-containing protein [Planctomycetaceae bacterium]